MRGRIRTIKPELFKDEDLWDLAQETGLPVLQAFEGLWCFADKEGRFEWRPRALKPDILPYWDGDFSRVLDALATRGFIVKYACGGREYGLVRTFKRHQVINNRESDSELPPPPADFESTATVPNTSTREARVEHATGTPLVHAQGEGKGREGNGKGNGSDASGTRDARARPVPVDRLPEPERGFTARRMATAFVAEFEAVQRTTPAMGGKHVDGLHAQVSQTARLQGKDPEALFLDTVRSWLSTPKSEVELRAPYACFAQAWGSLTAQGATQTAPGMPETVESVRQAGIAAMLRGDQAEALRCSKRADELQDIAERQVRRAR